MNADKRTNSRASISRNLLNRFYTLTFEAELQLSGVPLSPLADLCARSLLPKSYFSGISIEDIKGRDPVDLSLETTGAEKPKAHELLYIGATTYEDKEAFQDGEPSPFHLHLYSDFESYPNELHIAHRTRLECSRELPYPPHLAAFVCPGSLFALRFGFERYEPVRPIAFFGPSPTVVEQICIDGDTESVQIRITSERIPRKGELPFQGLELIQKLHALLASKYSFDFMKSLTTY